MVLSQPDIRKAVKSKRIVFDPPLEESQWGEASIDLRLGRSFTTFKTIDGVKVSVAGELEALGESGFWQTSELSEFDEFANRKTFVLKPNDFVLVPTYESVKVPNNLIGLIEGRSTYARIGLTMHQTAPWIQPGWSGPIILEIRNSGPLTIELTPLIDRPCQLTFLKLSTPLPRNLVYGSKISDVYLNQTHPIKQSRKTRSGKSR
jgi:dCTP deaminase